MADYQRRWGGARRVDIPPGPVLSQGQAGARVSALRLRLGLRPGQAFDAELRDAVRAFQAAHGLPATGAADAATVAALNLPPERFVRQARLDLARLEALPPPDAARYILVNVAAQRLQLVDGGRVRLDMPVVVGKPGQRTPEMAGLLRYVVLAPYWNVPEDLVRDSLAGKAARDAGYLNREGYEVLSDWSEAAKAVDATAIDWRAVAQGRVTPPRVRQKPGPTNVMGRVKFMLPNELGIYLHDFPDKRLFARSDRRLSSGCVRLADARALALALIGQDPEAHRGGETRVDLAEPLPVYITYLTAYPTAEGLRFAPDIYGKDAPALAAAADDLG